jgi:hypothetical protein
MCYTAYPGAGHVPAAAKVNADPQMITWPLKQHQRFRFPADDESSLVGQGLPIFQNFLYPRNDCERLAFKKKNSQKPSKNACQAPKPVNPLPINNIRVKFS